MKEKWCHASAATGESPLFVRVLLPSVCLRTQAVRHPDKACCVGWRTECSARMP